ncbi:AMP-binding protein [Elstera litoralis]|uniref:AMP-binding protein n=1 Tax=Elstera litoralis TaxID=552518 RepID=UPI000697571F|nr:AMP-binding protein [Elstera litoralis]
MSNAFDFWARRDLLRHFIADSVRAEFLSQHPDAFPPLPPWPEEFDFAEQLGADSLDRLSAATALSAQLRLDRAGLADVLLARRHLSGWVDVAEASLARYSESLQFRSSGSQGAPVWREHRLARFAAEIDGFLPVFGAGIERIIAVVPAHHIYGFLFTVLLPARLGIPVLDLRAASPGSVAAQIGPGDVIVGHPLWWRAFATASGACAPTLGLVSTAPCPPETAQAVRATGLARLIEIYGSTETAGIGWRDAGGGAFTLLDTWQPGADGGLLDDRGAVVSPPDWLDWQAERRFTVRGRKDGQVQVGGVNIDLAEVRACLMQVPGIADLALRLAETGRLKAFIVPAPDADEATLRQAVQALAKARLAAPARPTSWTFGPSLPMSETGKPADWPIAARGGLWD